MSETMTVIIPALNESGMIERTLEHLQDLRSEGHQVIVVDGGSSDATARLAEPLADVVTMSEPGRARQMNTGARLAKGQVLVFLHADTQLPQNAGDLVFGGLRRRNRRWGRFDVSFLPQAYETLVPTAGVNWRTASALTPRLNRSNPGRMACSMKPVTNTSHRRPNARGSV